MIIFKSTKAACKKERSQFIGINRIVSSNAEWFGSCSFVQKNTWDPTMWWHGGKQSTRRDLNKFMEKYNYRSWSECKKVEIHTSFFHYKHFSWTFWRFLHVHWLKKKLCNQIKLWIKIPSSMIFWNIFVLMPSQCLESAKMQENFLRSTLRLHKVLWKQQGANWIRG